MRRPDSPARQLLVGVLAALRDLGQDDLVSLADAYAAPAEQIAAADLAAILGRQGRDSQLEGVVIGTVLGDALLAALRRLAEENASVRAAPLSSPECEGRQDEGAGERAGSGGALRGAGHRISSRWRVSFATWLRGPITLTARTCSSSALVLASCLR